ncbi:hypothetical protein QVG61_01680 [Thiohalobacter sp. IOR34]|uniref:hypothetical protein n=1 Tax=Thiohalobacter sp. IOR34 TaxID=3057176 RepID=UPI0025AF87E0|nr:hypothetical protein [Thiohalobacter sp. IOR34]WJW75824.1 hypothetical protein QVG61_01680 [Thiohalobacter sp. IOR34]
MLLQQMPIPGYWYTNIVGQLVQVRAVLYAGSQVRRVVLEYANGKRDFLDLDGWYYLDLALHAPRLERRGQVRDL